MYLKKMEIKGFKSFPDKTEIIFPKGIISVVGPNGSGKSNILDAIRWVLGEQSMKSLRGEKLEDVIFSGTEKRKELNYCEVSLLIDNKDKMINIEYSEISIKRKAFKSGESQFFINNKSCRLKDIKELLLDTGIGREGYSIIGQGKIDEIINGNSIQRRKILEEAAGITKYRYKKEESEKKLDSTNENLERIKDIYKEIEKQILPLEIQKNKAEKYLLLKEKLLVSDVNRILKSYIEIENEELKINEIQSKIEIDLNSINTEISEGNKTLTDLEDKASFNRNLKKNIEEKYTNIEKEINTLTQNKELSDQQGINLSENLLKYKTQKELLQKEIENNENLFYKLNNEYEKLCKEKEIIEKEYIKQKESYSNLEIRINENEIIIENNRDKILHIMNEQSKLISRIEMIEQNIIDLHKKKQLSQIEEKKIQTKLNYIIEECEKNNIELSMITEELKELDLKLKQYSLKLDEINKSIDEIITIENRINIKISEHSSKVDLLKKMDEENEGFSKGVKEIINNKNLKGVSGVIANIIKVKSDYEKAIEAALGSQLQHIIVENANYAKYCIDYLKLNKLGRVTFLPIDTIKGKIFSYADIGIIAINLVEFDSKFSQIMTYLLGKIVIVENMEEAIKITKKYNHSFKVVTKEGEIFNAGGSITGGSVYSSYSILSRRKEICDNNKIVDELKEKLVENQLNRTNLFNEKDKLLFSINEIKDLIIKNNDIKNQEIIIEKDLLMQTEYINDSHKNLLNDIQIINKNISDADVILKKDKDLIEVLDKELNKLKIITSDLINQKNEDFLYFNKEDDKIRNIEIEKAKFIEIISSKIRERDSLNSLLDKQKKSLLDIDCDIDENNYKYKNITKFIFEIQKKIELLSKSNSEIQNDIIKSNEINIQINQEISIKSEEFRNKEKEYILLDTKKSKLDTELAKLEFQKKSHLEKIEEEYFLTIDNAKKLINEEVDTSKKNIEEIRNSIQKLGNINIDSIDEYEKVKERYDFYKDQKEDLEESIFELNNIILEIEDNMKIEFTQSFNEINLKFDEVFKILFGGGNASLVIHDNKDILSSDIEISVQPPGKKVRSISVLSGGEKALSAIAILFAILIRKPVPFCVLDEIDAPLDDANINRFITLLNILSQSTQFITITHRRGTMEASGYIYGVTMQEKGVSKLISLKLEEADNYIEN